MIHKSNKNTLKHSSKRYHRTYAVCLWASGFNNPPVLFSQSCLMLDVLFIEIYLLNCILILFKQEKCEMSNSIGTHFLFLSSSNHPELENYLYYNFWILLNFFIIFKKAKDIWSQRSNTTRSMLIKVHRWFVRSPKGLWMNKIIFYDKLSANT